MTNALIIYLAGSMLTLCVLSFMILKVGSLMADCPDGGPESSPENGRAARTTAIAVATGYAAIGAGGVLLIAGVLPLFGTMPFVAAPVALGFCALCLGLGFTQAVTTLRDVLSPTAKRAEGALPTPVSERG